MFYTSEPEALRTFLRDQLGFDRFTDTGGGWLIFDVSEAEIGAHPANNKEQSAHAGRHEISFYCDDIEQTVGELKARGVEFTSEVTNTGYGLVTSFEMPGGVDADLYQPLYSKLSE